MYNLVNKHNNIWEWHSVLPDPNYVMILAKEYAWDQYTNKGGGETVVGIATLVAQGSRLHPILMKPFFKCIEDYCLGNGLEFDPETIGQHPIMLREYNPGSKMAAHNDMYSYLKKDGNHVKPLLTAILYINDDYEGGQINFVHDGLCIAPKAGSMVVFPSHKQHEVLEILSGDRHMTQTYVYPKPISFYDEVSNG